MKPESKSLVPPKEPGETTKRIMLFALGLFFLVIAVVALAKLAIWWAFGFGGLALALFGIAMIAGKKTVDSAASVLQDLGR